MTIIPYGNVLRICHIKIIRLPGILLKNCLNKGVYLVYCYENCAYECICE